MNETELQRMVVRFTGDNTNYKEMLQDTIKNTESATNQVVGHAQKVQNFANTLRDFALSATAAMALLGASEWFDVLNKEIEKATGGVASLSASFTRLASNVLKATAAISSLITTYTAFRAANEGLSLVALSATWKTAWAAASGAVVTSLGAVKAAIIAVSVAAAASPAAAFAWTAAAVVGIVNVATAIIGYRDHLAKVQEQLEKNDMAHIRAMESYRKSTDEILYNINRMSSGADRSKGFEKQYQAAYLELEELNEAYDKAKKKHDDFRSLSVVFNPFSGSNLRDYFGMTERSKEAEQAKVHAAQAAYEAEERLNKLEDEWANDPALEKSIASLKAEFEQQTAVLGKTGGAARLAALEYKMLTDSSDKLKKQLVEAKDALQKLEYAKATKDASDFIDSLNMQRVTAGKNADEIKRMNLVFAQLSAGKVNQAQILHIDALIDEKKTQEQLDKLKEKAKSMAQELRTPLEVYQDKVEELDSMLDKNVVTQELYNKAMEKAKKGYDDATKSAMEQRKELERLDAAQLGSAEHAARMRSYLNVLRQRDEKSAPTPDRKEQDIVFEKSNVAPAVSEKEKQMYWLENIYQQLVKNGENNLVDALDDVISEAGF